MFEVFVNGDFVGFGVFGKYGSEIIFGFGGFVVYGFYEFGIVFVVFFFEGDLVGGNYVEC